MTKVNIREALNQMDKDTNCKYDLVTLYEGYNFNDEEKKEIAKMISDNEDAEVIYDRLSDKFGKDVDFDDDDISDITTEEFDDNDISYLDLLDDEPFQDDEMSNIYGGDRNICPECGSSNYHDGHCYACNPNYVPDELEENKNNSELVDDLINKAFTKEQAEYLVSHDEGMAEYLAYGNADNDDFEYFTKYINKRLNEDTIKTSKGKWVNKGEEGTHGTFDTKKEADAQRKAMFASGWKSESLKEASYGGAYDIADDEYFTKDDGMEAANEVAYQLEKEFPESKLEVMDMQLDNHSFYVTLTDKEGNEFSEEITLDMRKIRHPLDLIKKYAPALTERFIKQIKDYYSEM